MLLKEEIMSLKESLYNVLKLQGFYGVTPTLLKREQVLMEKIKEKTLLLKAQE